MTVNDITDEMITNEWESLQMRTCVRLMMARATFVTKAIDPKGVLPLEEVENLRSLARQGYVFFHGNMVYLSARGMLIANMGLQRIFEKYIWKDNEVAIDESI